MRDRLTAGKLDELFKPIIKAELKDSKTPVARGLNASPGAAVGRAVFDADTAVEWVNNGEKVILVRIETSHIEFRNESQQAPLPNGPNGPNEPRAAATWSHGTGRGDPRSERFS